MVQRFLTERNQMVEIPTWRLNWIQQYERVPQKTVAEQLLLNLYDPDMQQSVIEHAIQSNMLMIL